MERNENGMPVIPKNNAGQGVKAPSRGACQMGENGVMKSDACLDSLPLAYAYVPWQKWQMLYKPAEALMAGTMFEELDKPMGVYANE